MHDSSQIEAPSQPIPTIRLFGLEPALDVCKGGSDQIRIELPDFDNQWIVYYTGIRDPQGTSVRSAQDGRHFSKGNPIWVKVSLVS